MKLKRPEQDTACNKRNPKTDSQARPAWYDGYVRERASSPGLFPLKITYPRQKDKIAGSIGWGRASSRSQGCLCAQMHYIVAQKLRASSNREATNRFSLLFRIEEEGRQAKRRVGMFIRNEPSMKNLGVFL